MVYLNTMEHLSTADRGSISALYQCEAGNLSFFYLWVLVCTEERSVN